MSKPVRRHRRPYRNGYVRQHSRGTRAERRFFEAIRRYRRLLPQWLFDIRQATPELDRAGVDAVIYTTEAIFYPNIKSDADGKFQFNIPPGDYVVNAANEGISETCSPVRVTVGPDEMGTIAISCDTGIR